MPEDEPLPEKTARPHGPAVSVRVAAAAMAICALVLALLVILASRHVEPFRGWFYQFAWYPTLVLADAAYAWRHGEYPLLGRPRFALSLLLWSIPMWLAYEVANFRLANWYYVNVAAELPLRWLGGAVAFATVLPALYLGYRWAATLPWPERWRGPRFQPSSRILWLLFAGGVAFVLLAVWRPGIFYPLLWGAATLLLEPFNYGRAPERSLLGDLAEGRYGRIAALLGGGLAIGILWETFNSVAGARWIYTVPGLEEMKLFEMPLPGFLGFPVLALDGFVIYTTLSLLGIAWPGWNGSAARPARDFRPTHAPPETGAAWRRAGRARRWSVWIAAGIFSLAAFAGIDRWTVDSYGRSLGEVMSASRDGAAGVQGDQAPALTAAAAGEIRELAGIRGVGVRNALILHRVGISSACDLAAAETSRVSEAIAAARSDPHAGKPARVRVWIRAAREACDGRARRASRRPRT